MPLTFAHPAVLIPFKFLPKKYYSWTGLIIGSIVPDFEAFIKLGGEKQFSHSWWGMFVFDLPLGLLLAFLFHAVVRDALIDNLPAGISKKLCGIKHINWIHSFRQRYGVIILSLLIGIFTHLIWDRITHTDTYTYHHKAGLNIAPDMETLIRQWLQWTNSIVGIALLAYQFHILPSKSFSPSHLPNYWYIVGATVSLLLSIRVHSYFFVDDLVNTFIAGFFLGIVFASTIVIIRNRKAAIIP